MMHNNGRIRGLAFVTGTALVASAFAAPAPVKADKADNLKIGATVLAGAAAVLAAKGKTVPAAIAGAAGYYAYKKGRDEDRKKNDYPYYGQSTPYPTYPGTAYPSNNYPTGTTYPSYGNDYPTYGNYPTNSDYPAYNYPSNSYPSYNQPTYSNYPTYGNNGSTSNCHDGNTSHTGSYNGGYQNGNTGSYNNGGYNNGYDRYPSSYSAVAPKSAASAPRSNQKVVLR